MATFRFRADRWQVQIRRKGSPPVTKTFILKRDAEAWARQTEACLERGDIPAEIRSSSERRTLAEIVIRYRDTISIRKKGHDVERIVLNAFLRDPIAALWADALTQGDFAEYRDRRLLTVCSNTLRREFSTLHHMLEVARSEWSLSLRANPLHKLRVGRSSPHRERRLQSGEECRLMASADQCRSKMIRPFISMALETGMRRGELLKLLWSDVDIEARSVLVRDAKNGSSRHIPLTKRATMVLASLPRDNALVFPMRANAFRLTWERLRKRADLEDLHFHDLRHEAVSRLFELGLTAPEVALVSGHRDARMLFRYAHPMRQRVLQIMDSAGEPPR